MIHGLDTGFLVAAEILEHSDHLSARATLQGLVTAGDRFALAPQVVAEFIHIVTDPRRFQNPLDIPTALRVAESWWTAREVDHVFPDAVAIRQFLLWIPQFQLGRKRLLDTLLAATFHENGIGSILTTNVKDFAIFGVFRCITP